MIGRLAGEADAVDARLALLHLDPGLADPLLLAQAQHLVVLRERDDFRRPTVHLSVGRRARWGA